MNNIAEIWKEQSALASKEVVKHRIVELDIITCFIGTICFSSNKIFTLEIASDIKVHPNYLKRFAGVEVQILPTSNGVKELVIILMDNELSDVFVMFIEDIIKSLSLALNSEEALFTISRRIAYWKKLFGKFTGGLLTPEQQRGLFGELYFLKQLLISDFNSTQVVEAWQAPEAANQDYYFGGNAIEIKTSKSNSPLLTISNEYQLDVSGFKEMYVCFYHLNEHLGKENTLTGIISEIRKLFSKNLELIRVFDHKLEQLGVDRSLDEEYDQTSYRIRKEKYYQIRDDFPKITSQMVNESISKISYQIDPIGCVEFETKFNTLLNTLKNGTS